MINDYVTRMIEQITQAILAIIGFRKSENYKEARKVIKSTGRYLLRMDIDLLLLFTYDQILDHFKDLSKCYETEKCVLGADLFHEMALIEQVENKPEKALRLKMLSLHLYTIGIPKEKQFQNHQYLKKVSKLTEELVNYSLPHNLLKSLKSYQEFTKQT
jgi:hypothetical protein